MNTTPDPAKPTPVSGDAPAPSDSGVPPAPVLSPEEQMALYEKELKETDWGHQPC